MSAEAKMQELQFLQEKHGDLLKPEHVVEFASDERTALHSEFEWDDTEAAHQYRLEQARRVLRLKVIVDSPAGKQHVRMFVSLMSDRQKPGGGYRPLVEVMTADDMRDELLRQALAELKTVRKKYQLLQELRPVFKAIERVEEKTQKQPV